jgi:hypothetical protein
MPTNSEHRSTALAEAIDEVGVGSGIDIGGTGTRGGRPPGRPVWVKPQVHAYPNLVVAVFPSDAQAEQGLRALRNAGFGPSQVGLVARDGELTHTSGVLAGCADSGPFDALVELGVPGDAARLYQQSFEACQAIVAVPTGGTPSRVIDALRPLVAANGSG